MVALSKLNNGDQVIAEYDGSDNLLRKFIYGPGIDEPICMIDCTGESDVWYFYHLDGLGSVVALSNTSGSIVEKYTYDVFGKCDVIGWGDDETWDTGDDYDGSVSPVDNPYMFTARRYDDETGLYYYRTRMYAPNLGRFLQPDPIGYDDGMNMYAYVGNNPTSYVDPFGLRNTDRHMRRWDKFVRFTFGTIGTISEKAHALDAAILYGTARYIHGAEWALAKGLHAGIEGLSMIGDVPEVYIGPIGYTPEIHFDPEVIATFAEATLGLAGDFLEEHAEVQYELAESNFYWHNYYFDVLLGKELGKRSEKKRCE